MKKIAIIFGGTFGLYHGRGVFREIEKKFNCTIMRISKDKLKTKINEVQIDFYICNSPIRDKSYNFQKKWMKISQWKELIPLPANETAKRVGKPNVVLFFGYCGTLLGKKSNYTPETFKEIFFDRMMTRIEEPKIKIDGGIKIKNILKNKIKADNVIVITSNVTLAPVHEKPESREKLISIAKRLSKFGDVVEKESYQIVKHFRNKIPVGVYIQSSDVLTNKRHMLHRKMETDKNKFNNNVVKSIKIALDKIK